MDERIISIVVVMSENTITNLVAGRQLAFKPQLFRTLHAGGIGLHVLTPSPVNPSGHKQ